MKTEKVSFETWMERVDKFVYLSCGLSVDDLNECCYADWYDDGMGAGRAAKKAMKYSGAELD